MVPNPVPKFANDPMDLDENAILDPLSDDDEQALISNREWRELKHAYVQSLFGSFLFVALRF